MNSAPQAVVCCSSPRKRRTFESSTMLALAIMVVFLVTPRSAFAKDMANRLGIGYENQFSVDMPGIAAKFFPTHDLAVSGVVGIDTQQNSSRFGMLGKIQKIVFHEDNLHFYMGAGAGVLSDQASSTTNSGFVLMAFCGAEFFSPDSRILALALKPEWMSTRYRMRSDSGRLATAHFAPESPSIFELRNSPPICRVLLL